MQIIPGNDKIKNELHMINNIPLSRSVGEQQAVLTAKILTSAIENLELVPLQKP